jgi:hypothetical protein
MHTVVYLCLLVLLAPLTALARVDPCAYCLNNLRHLDGAKEQLAIVQKLKPGDSVELTMLMPYLSGHAIPQCLSGGRYTVGPIGVYPVCSVPGHTEAAFHRRIEQQKRQERILLWVLIVGGIFVATWVALSVHAARKRAKQAANPAATVDAPGAPGMNPVSDRRRATDQHR